MVLQRLRKKEMFRFYSIQGWLGEGSMFMGLKSIA